MQTIFAFWNDGQTSWPDNKPLNLTFVGFDTVDQIDNLGNLNDYKYLCGPIAIMVFFSLSVSEL